MKNLLQKYCKFLCILLVHFNKHKPLISEDLRTTVSPRAEYRFVQKKSDTVRNLHCVKHLIDHKNWSRKTTLIRIITT